MSEASSLGEENSLMTAPSSPAERQGPEKSINPEKSADLIRFYKQVHMTVVVQGGTAHYIMGRNLNLLVSDS